MRRFFGKNKHHTAGGSSADSSGNVAVTSANSSSSQQQAQQQQEDALFYARVESGSSSSSEDSPAMTGLPYASARISSSRAAAAVTGSSSSSTLPQHSAAAATALQFAVPVDNSSHSAVQKLRPATATTASAPVNVDDYLDDEAVGNTHQHQQHQYTDDHVVPLEQEELAHAWFARRHLNRLVRQQQKMIKQQQSNSSSHRQSRPIDVDTVQEYYPGQQYLQSVDAPSIGSEAGMISIATSDRTPVVSNRRGWRSLTIGGNAPASVSSGTNPGAGTAGGLAVSVGDTIHEEHDGLGSAATTTWRGYIISFCNLRTGWGKLAILLLCVIILGLITVVTSATINGQSKKQQEPPVVLSTGTVLSARPTQAPSLAPLSSAPTTTPSLQPTASPTTPPQTEFRSIALNQVQPSLSGVIQGEAFGSSIAVSKDGRVMIVGAPEVTVNGLVKAGSAQVFQRNRQTGRWLDRGLPLTGRNQGDQFGSAVAVSADGSVVAVSEPTHSTGAAGDRAGNVRIFTHNPATNQYVPAGQVPGTVAASYFGVSVALSDSGTVVAVGAPYLSGVNRRRLHGQVRVYGFNGSEWGPLGEPLSGSGNFDWLGWDVQLSPSGRVLVASAPRNNQYEGYVRAWEWRDEGDFQAIGEWVPLGNDMINEFAPAASSDFFGQSISLSSTDTTYRVAVGIPFKDTGSQGNSGMTVVYEYDDLTRQWLFMGSPLTPDVATENDQAGYAVDLVAGNLLAVGVPGYNEDAGMVQLYQYDEDLRSWERHPDTWVGQDRGDDFGFSIGLAKAATNDIVLNVGALTANRGDVGYVATFQQQAIQTESLAAALLMPCTSRNC